MVKKGHPNNSPLSPYWSTGVAVSILPLHPLLPDIVIDQILKVQLGIQHSAEQQFLRPHLYGVECLWGGGQQWVLIVCSVSWSRWKQALLGQASRS